jgi:hypothetical protein
LKQEFLTKQEATISYIRHDVFELVKFTETFIETWNIINECNSIKVDSEKELGEPRNRFFFYLKETFLQYSLSAIRRHSRYNQKHDKPSTRSLIHLLKKISKQPNLVDRKYYIEKIISKYANFNEVSEEELIEEANIIFDNLSSPENLNFLCIEKLQKDISEVENSTKNICDFVDKNIAHLEDYVHENNVPEEVSFIEIQKSVELIRNVTEKYLMLFNDKGIDNEALNYDGWKDCFRFPWIR